MDNEPYRDLNHEEVAAYVTRTLALEGHGVEREFRLPSRRVADVMVHHVSGHVHIIEVKDYLSTSLIEAASRKYWHWCEYLWIASPNALFAPVQNHLSSIVWPQRASKVGLLHAAHDGIHRIRPAIFHEMVTSHRSRLALPPRNPCEEGGRGLLG